MRQVQCNHYSAVLSSGHFLLTQRLLPLLANSSDGRILNVSSVHHVRGQIFFENINNDVPNGSQQSQRQYSQFGEEMNKNSTAAEALAARTHS